MIFLFTLQQKTSPFIKQAGAELGHSWVLSWIKLSCVSWKVNEYLKGQQVRSHRMTYSTKYNIHLMP